MLDVTIYVQTSGIHNSTGSHVASLYFSETEMQSILKQKQTVTILYPKDTISRQLYSPANTCRFFLQNCINCNIQADFFCIEVDITYPEDCNLRTY